MTSNKKVLIIVENLAVPFDRRVWQEAIALTQNGFLVCIICPKMKGYSSSYEYMDGIHIYRHSLLSEGNGVKGYILEYFSALYWQFILSIKVFLRHGFDIIHMCNPPDLIFLVAILYKLIGKKIIFDHHDLSPELYEAKFNKRDVFYKLLCIFEKLTFRMADIVISTNESYKEVALSRGLIDESRVFIVRSGPKLDRLVKSRSDPSIKNRKSILISYVGVIGQQEGINHLIDSLYILVNELHFTDFYCIICGSGPALVEMQQYAERAGIVNFVRFTGRISDEELLKILNSSDICVNPDVWNEMNDKSTMNKIMEYMALGKPIVQYDLREGRFSAKEASLYAKPNDRRDFAEKILSLANNKELRCSMGEYGFKRIKEELEWKYEEPKLIYAYNQLINSLKI